jgi:ATP adenylyltransferase
VGRPLALGIKQLSTCEYGIFVRLREGVEALIPSNDAEESEDKPIKRGDKVRCEITSVDGVDRRVFEAELGERLVVVRTAHAQVMLNRYPFAAAHLLVIPHKHTSALEELDDEEHDALFRLVRATVVRLKRAVKCEGLNVGLNLGAPAGAGIAEHLHVHVVPRWSGDTNFMPVLADVRVVPQALDATRAHLAPYFADLAEPPRV